MDVIFPDAGLVFALRQIIGTGLWYNLFDNDVLPALGDTLATYHPPAWSGYARLFVPIASWNLSQVVGHVGGIQAPPIAFVNLSGSPQIVYGYYVTDLSGMVLIAAARFDSAPNTIAVADAQNVTPILGNYSGLSS